MCSCCNKTYYGDLERHFFVRSYEHLGMTPFTGEQVNNTRASVIIDDVFLKDYDTSFEDLIILLKEREKFKLQLKESLLIRSDKLKLNGNIYSYPLELFY